jgi:hypothetical protein
MILRRPYAFLVKHFRLIHVILLLLTFFIFLQSGDIVGFFNDYIDRTGYIDFEIVAKNLIGFFSVFLDFLILLICGILVYLLKYKRKPVLFYVICMALYFVIMLTYFFLPSFIGGMGFNPPSAILVRVIRDVYTISLIAQIGIMGITFVRAIGFDIKKFDFKRDVQDLGITDEDNEEFEFEFNLDTDDILTKIKKRIRYLKYFYKENKLIFFVGYAVLAFIIVSSIFTYITGLEHVYHEGDMYSVGNINYTVLKTYNTVLNSKGNRINDKYFYTIVKIRAANNSGWQSRLNVSNIKLYYDKYHSVTPNNTVYENFKEYGVQYFNQILSPYEIRDFILIYQIPISNYNNNFKLRTVYNLERKDGATVFNYRTVRLHPEYDTDKTTKVKEVGLNEELSFEGSILGKTTIKIKSYELKDSFTYNSKICLNGKCDSKTNFITASSENAIALTVMRLNYEIKYDYSALGKNYNVSDFLARFGRIRYVIDGIKDNKDLNHNIVIKDLTAVYTNKLSFIEVKNILKRADIIYIDFTIKDKVYTIKLKDVLKETQEAKAKEQLNQIENEFK